MSFSLLCLFSLAGVADRQMMYAVALLVKKGLASGLKSTKETFFQMLISFLEELYSLAFSIAVRCSLPSFLSSCLAASLSSSISFSQFSSRSVTFSHLDGFPDTDSFLFFVFFFNIFACSLYLVSKKDISSFCLSSDTAMSSFCLVVIRFFLLFLLGRRFRHPSSLSVSTP